MDVLFDASFVHVEILRSMHEQLRAQFEPKILAAIHEPEVQVLAGLTHRTVRLALAAEVLCRNGLADAAGALARTSSECTVNLLYIMYVGPHERNRNLRKSSRLLAEQFVGFADVEYWRGYSRRQSVARKAFAKNGRTEAEIDTQEVELKRLYDSGIALGCTKLRWHSLPFDAMAGRVRDNPPPFIITQLADPLYSSFMAENSAVHGGPLSLRLHFRSLGIKPLELVPDRSDTYANGAAVQALWCWYSLADYFGELEISNRCYLKHMRAVCRERVARA